MNFHPVTTDFMFTKFELENNEKFTGILGEFYACPQRGKTALPVVEESVQKIEKASSAYAWGNMAPAELF